MHPIDIEASDLELMAPREVVERVESYVDRELADARKYENRGPLDESGVWSLHRLAAEIYALGFEAGEIATEIRALGRERRRADSLPETQKGDTE